MAGNDFDYNPNHVRLQARSKNMFISEHSAAYVRPKITERSQLAVGFQPSHLSVICGRGKDSDHHTGNCRFLKLASTFVEKYSRAGSKTTKMSIVFHIVTMIRQAGGNFCRYMFERGAWFEVGDRCARGKVSSLLRAMLQTKDRTSTEVNIIRGRDRNRNETRTQQVSQELVEGIGPGNDSSMASSCLGSSTDSLGLDYSKRIDFQLLDGTGQQLFEGTGKSNDSSTSGGIKDFLGFDCSLEIDCSDIDVFNSSILSPSSGSSTDSLGFDLSHEIDYFGIDHVF